MKPTVENLAIDINKSCEDYKYFFAYQLVKESIILWKKNYNYKLLGNDAQIMVNRIIKAK